VGNLVSCLYAPGVNLREVQGFCQNGVSNNSKPGGPLWRKILSELPRLGSVSVMRIYLGLKIQLMRAKRHPCEFTSSVGVNDRGARP